MTQCSKKRNGSFGVGMKKIFCAGTRALKFQRNLVLGRALTTVSALVCFFVFLYIGFFYLSINRVSAASLEVQYPVISGQNINTEPNLTLPSYVKYLFNAGMFLGFFAVFISLTVAGAMYFLSPISAEFLSESKDRVAGAISGLLILVLTYLIITTINPQLSIFNISQLPPIPPPPTAPPAEGVYFYKSGCPVGSGGIGDTCSSDIDCSAQEECDLSAKKCVSKAPNISSITDLGPLKNQVNAVQIIQGATATDTYISILYDNINLWGKCQYINPDGTCQAVDRWGASASVYKYDFSPGGDGVYFFRKSCLSYHCTINGDCSNGETCNTTTGACAAIGGGSADNTADLIKYCQKPENGGGWYQVINDDIKKGITDPVTGSKNAFSVDLNSLTFTNVPDNEQICTKYDVILGECVPGSRQPPTLGGENISSMIIHGNYLVLLVYKGPSDNLYGPWTYCQEFPTVNDVNKIGPQQIKWQNIRNTSYVVPNDVVIIPIQK